MNTWFEFLTAQGANWQQDNLCSFADAGGQNGLPALIPMTSHRILQVEGRDAAQFLQGQVTCDIRRLTQHDVLLGAHCNPKGRMISSFILAAMAPECLGLRLRANLADTALAALKKYIVFAKARIDHAPQVALALCGDLSRLPLKALPEPGKFIQHDFSLYLRHSLDLLEVWTTETEARMLWHNLVPSCIPASPTLLDQYWVQKGLAEVQAATTEAFIPQMFNYHLIDGVSFKKGCYTGQEIVARMQYRGQLKKHIYAVVSDQLVAIPPGAELTSAADPEQVVGVVAAGATTASGWIGLVVTTQEYRNHHPWLLEKKTEAKLEWAPLPYAIPNSEI